jgi:dienelactone hydrolase
MSIHRRNTGGSIRSMARRVSRIALFLALLPGAPAMLDSASAASRLVGDLPRLEDKPLEALPGLDTEYGVLATKDGARLRTLVTKPVGSSGRLPAVLFVQWLSCDTIELDPAARDGWQVMMRRLIMESNMLWFRTEKAGVGDSRGPACAQLDYETELAHHRAAFDALRRRADVDPKRIVVYGASMGSNYAPLVAADQDIAGVVVWGGGAHTWFERMMRFERNALALRAGNDPQALAPEMQARARYFARYLLGGESPSAIARTDPELGRMWSRIVGTNADGTHYGRPAAFHQQAQRQNWSGAWARVRSPVLVLYGEYDWFESRDAASTIVEVVNGQRPGTASLQVFPGLDHHFTRFPSAAAAFAGQGGTEHAAPVVESILAWLRRIGVNSPRA